MTFYPCKVYDILHVCTQSHSSKDIYMQANFDKLFVFVFVCSYFYMFLVSLLPSSLSQAGPHMLEDFARYWPHMVATRLEFVDIRKCLISFKRTSCLTHFRLLRTNPSHNLIGALSYHLAKCMPFKYTVQIGKQRGKFFLFLKRFSVGDKSRLMKFYQMIIKYMPI